MQIMRFTHLPKHINTVDMNYSAIYAQSFSEFGYLLQE